jgi:hypothetical protein
VVRCSASGLTHAPPQIRLAAGQFRYAAAEHPTTMRRDEKGYKGNGVRSCCWVGRYSHRLQASFSCTLSSYLVIIHIQGYCFTVRYLEDCSVVPTYFAVTHILTGIGRVKRVYGLLQDLPVHNLLSRFRRPIKQRAVDHLSNCLYYPYPKR